MLIPPRFLKSPLRQKNILATNVDMLLYSKNCSVCNGMNTHRTNGIVQGSGQLCVLMPDSITVKKGILWCQYDILQGIMIATILFPYHFSFACRCYKRFDFIRPLLLCVSLLSTQASHTSSDQKASTPQINTKIVSYAAGNSDRILTISGRGIFGWTCS